MGKTWFITGCSSGLGKTLAQRALLRGHSVVATARNPGQLAELVASAPERCRAVALDVTNAAQNRAAVEEALAVFGAIDVLCPNAGYGMIGGLEECSPEQVERNLATNLLGPMHLFRAALPAMRAARKGHVLAVSAIAALSNHEGFSVYGGAKAGLEGVCEALAIELKPLGIKVTIVLPGPTRTDFASRSLEPGAVPIPDYQQTAGKFAAFLKQIVGKQTGDPVKVADLMIDVTEDPAPPLRLVTGRYAVNRARAKLRSLGAEMDAWEARSLATDF
jgi:NAD(P)-dependent dehydrogenase (short-subunit alcohol dehydrogenase family)